MQMIMYIPLSIVPIKKKTTYLVKSLQLSHVDQVPTTGKDSEYELCIWPTHMYRYLTVDQKKS